MATPVVEKVESADDFQRIVDKSTELLKSLTPVEEDYPKVYEELKNLNVATSSNPSLQQISVEMQKVQSAKDRVSQILVDVHRNFIVRKRVCELLREGWVPFSSHSAAEKRRGESFVKMSQFIESASEAECLYKAAAHIMENLDSKHESLSRQITVYNLALKLNDFSGGSLDKNRQLASVVLGAQKSNNNDLKDGKDLDDKKEDDEDLYDWDKK
jgi:hypothetical protein